MIENKTILTNISSIVRYILLILITLSCILPLLHIFAISVSSNEAVVAGDVILLPKEFNLLAYSKIAQEKAFFRSIFVSVCRVVLAIVINFFVILMAAYPLSKRKNKFKNRNVVMWILVFFMLFQGGLIPLYLVIKQYSLMNSVLGLVLSGGLPIFNIILLMNFFRDIPSAIEESAEIDGATPFQVLFRIYTPLAVPAIATIMLFTIVYHWNEFFHGLIFSTSQDSYPLQTYIKQLVIIVDPSSLSGDKEALAAALSNETLNAAKIFITMIPIMMIYPFLQKYFVKGIVIGSVKG